MSTYTPIRSRPAIGLGLLFASGTAYVLFEDVLVRGASLTTDHVLSSIALVGVIYATHALFGVIADGRNLLAVGFAALILSGAFVIAVKSAGRNAETYFSKAGEITRANEARARADADLEAARKALREAKEAEAAECGSGRGEKCKGRKSTTEARAAEIAPLEAARASLGAMQDDRAAIRYAARVVALLPSVEAPVDVLAERLELLLPAALTLVLELGSAVCFAAGFHHPGRRRDTSMKSETIDTSAEHVHELPPQNDNDPTPGSRVRAREEVIDWVRAYRARHGRLPQIPEVQARFPGVARSTAHRRIRAA